MRNFILDVLIFFLRILICVLVIPTAFAVFAGVMATAMVVLVTLILLSPIGLMCVVKEYLDDGKKNDLTKDE